VGPRRGQRQSAGESETVETDETQWETLKTNMDVVDAMIKRKEK
jgi:hypothetical protein